MSAPSYSEQRKLEKKAMDEKIAKVREVVRNVSANDIVLALHNFEMDVEKTIHAFCEGGSENALGDWEQPTNAKKRQQKKGGKAPTSGGGVSSAPQLKPTSAPAVNGGSGGSVKSFASSHADAPSTNSIPTTPNNINGHGYDKNQNNNGYSSVPVSSAQKGKPVVAASATQAPKASASASAFSDIGAINAHATKELDALERSFDKEVAHAETRLLHTFGELRQFLSEREQRLREELSNCRRQGISLFGAQRSAVQQLKAQGQSQDKQQWEGALKAFNAEHAKAVQMAQTALFQASQYDELVDAIRTFGIVPFGGRSASQPKGNTTSTPRASTGPIPLNKVGVAGAGASPMKSTPPASNNNNGGQRAGSVNHSASHSSLVSSVGEDSGVGQVSPTAATLTATTKSVVAQVENGSGIVMQSDAFSEDQLADLQRRIEESLKAQGIDPSVLSNAGLTSVAPRRRGPRGGNGGGGGNGGRDRRDSHTNKDGNQPRGAAAKAASASNGSGGGGGGSGGNRNRQRQAVAK